VISGDRSDTEFALLSADRVRHADQVCDCFEALWQSGQRPRIEAFLEHASEPSRALLLRELVSLEVAYRRKIGESPRLSEYRTRFPDRDIAWLTRALDAAVVPTALIPCTQKNAENSPTSDDPELVVARLSDSSDPGSSPRNIARRLGKFELIERVGVGASGSVWRARDLQLGRVVAVKIPHPELVEDATDLERIYREARTVAQLRHPGIVSVHELCIHEGLPILVSDFVVGTTLRDLLVERRLSHREAAALVAKVADAVGYAHTLGAIHRDLKPANIMIDFESADLGARGSDLSQARSARQSNESPESQQSAAASGPGEPRIVDFGLAFRDQDGPHLTLSGQLVGTPAYMSPEQACSGATKLDGRSDVYSLGVVLYEALSGVLPFVGTRSEILRQLAHDEPRRLRTVVRRVPRDLETICHKAMSKNPNARYATARDLADDLRRYMDGESIRARPVRLWERIWRYARRRPAEAAAAAMVAVTAVAVVVLAVGSRYHVQLKQQYRETDLARQAEAAERRRAVTYHYYSRMALAEREYSANNIERVKRLLSDCPPALRGWEWSYLARRCHQEQLTVRHDSAPSESSTVTRVVFSPDGHQLATASRDGFVRLWDSSTGSMVRVVGQHDSSCLAIAFHPDGSRLASGGGDHLIKIWDRATGRLLRTLNGHDRDVYCVAYSPDGSRLASGDGFPAWEAVEHLRSPGVVNIWNEATGERLWSLGGHTQNVMGLAFRPDGRRLASVSGGILAIPLVANKPGELLIWNMETGKPIRAVRGHDGPLTSVAYSPNGEMLATSSWDSTVRLWDADTGSWRSTLSGHRDWVSQVAFAPDGERLATAGADGSVQVWSTATGEPLLTFRGHAQKVTSVAFDPRGRQIASASSDQTVKVWDSSANPECLVWQESAPVVHLAFLPDNQRLILAANHEATDGQLWPVVSLLEPATGRAVDLCRNPLPVGLNIHGLALDRTGQKVALTFGGAKTEVRDVASGSIIHSFDAADQGQVQGVAFSPKGSVLAVSGLAQRPAAGGSLTSHDLAAYLAAWDLATGRNLWTRISFDLGKIRSVDFSPDGRLVATADNEASVTLWDAATGATVRSLLGHCRLVSSIAFSPDGKRLASASWDQTAIVWDVTSGRAIVTLRGHMRSVLCVAFSPDGTRVATGSEDQTVKLWDAATGEEVLTLRGHTALVSSVAFSHDGRLLASAGRDGVVLVREAEPAQPDLLGRPGSD
jgi:WD40 repeat protein/serine/threonine protein kinase